MGEAKQNKPNPQSMDIGNTHMQVEISKSTRKKRLNSSKIDSI